MANRRMHNKSFTADNQATIIGGRNVGDEYFDATQGFVFVDRDVMAVGPVVKDMSNAFDGYWAMRLGYYVALVGIIISGVLLIIDLNRPERFWHMLVQSKHGWPMLQ
jgi:Polysulphide reductase, NrfD